MITDYNSEVKTEAAIFTTRLSYKLILVLVHRKQNTILEVMVTEQNDLFVMADQKHRNSPYFSKLFMTQMIKSATIGRFRILYLKSKIEMH